MSRHRFVKALDLDDELDAFDGEEGLEDEYDRNEDPRMRDALAEARAFLGDDFLDKDIQDSLWHYYYDVEKTVQYLIAQKEKSNQPKATPKTPKKPKDSLRASILTTPNCARPFSAKDYFADCPWLRIPLHRQGEIIVEPLYPRGGLLGGSSKDAPKKSKLAALAASRKQKAQESSDKSTNTAVNLLDKLTDKSTNTKVDTKGQMTPTRKYPTRRQEPNLITETVQEEVHVEEAPIEAKEESVEPVLSTSKPSTFASTMLGLQKTYQQTDTLTISYNPFELECDHIEANINPFSGPSPDDIVAKAQSASKGMKAKSQPKVKDQNLNGASDLSDGLSKATIADVKPPKSKNLDVLEEFKRSNSKASSNFVVIGHVDAGKSTLMGRLLYDLKVVDQRTIDKYRREAEKIGKSSFALAWVLDQGTEEREHGVTIDIAMNKFETDKTAFTILDAPGHKDFVPNMIAGAAQADFAILVIDASTGSFESGLKGQTKEHAFLVRSMGVQRLIVAVNKMDAVEWSKTRYDEITQQMEAFLTSTAGFQPTKISFVPCSGLKGDNITKSSTECEWYTEPTLLTLLETAEPTSQVRALNGPLRLPISQVFSSSTQFPLSVAGRISSGAVQVADAITIIPGGQTGFVKGIAVDDEPTDWAVAGQNTTLHLSADIDAKLVKGGDMVCASSAPMPLSNTLVIKLLAFDHVMPMYCSIVVGRLDVSARISKLLAVLDKSSGKTAAGRGKKPRVVKPNEAARVEVIVDTEGGIPIEGGARIVLRAEGETIATGIVESAK